MEAVDRSFRILDTVCAHESIALKDVAALVGLTPPTTLRLLRALQDSGVVRQNDDRTWSPTMKVWKLGQLVSLNNAAARDIEAKLTRLSEVSGETAVYSSYDKGWCTYLIEVPSKHSVRVHAELGARYHASVVASGHVALAHSVPEDVDAIMLEHWGEERWTGSEGDRLRSRLRRIATDGFVHSVRSQVWRGVWSISLPDIHGGKVFGAFAVVGPMSRRDVAVDEIVTVGKALL